ncbi:solute carrier organic anion transporter family member 74D [Halyomorpha halys]|uniref:solute carrier organic anion transporter family member 74D n=1 Tax=Halyomorpha halys TaxID=286706 RepID=UPI0006D4F2F1|nr:solute carrier organic anion transporter family member 2A1-like [Halyomorpha halys]
MEGDKMEAEGMLRDKPSKETTCGIGFIKGPWLQKFANYKAYVILYGLLGCMFTASFSYAGGIFTTMEKRFKIPSQTMGIISVGNDMSQILVLTVFSYYVGKGHRPRWIAVGIYTVVIFCVLNACLYFFFGPGQDAISLSYEYGSHNNISEESREKELICQDGTNMKCDSSDGNDWGPTVTLFMAQLISGFGGSLFGTLGVSYMDDNTKKSKSPAIFGVSQCLKMFGNVVGYGLASICLNIYISPSLTPRIKPTDPRWVGAFWIGWIILGSSMFVLGSLVGLFPRVLPDAARRRDMREKTEPEEEPASLKDFLATFVRLFKNKVVMCKTMVGILYVFGYLPYWMYMPKYFEVIFKQSAAVANLATGFVGLICSAIGILLSGFVISRFKPKARTLSMWNFIVKVITICGFIVYNFLGCAVNDMQGDISVTGELNATQACNADCHCDFVKYSPVCAYGKSFISPCHAGCNDTIHINGTIAYSNCGCVNEFDANGIQLPQIAMPGICPVDCSDQFKLFLVVVCILKLLGATSQTSNFIVSMRSVEERDKTVAMGFGMTMITIFALIPAPIFFGRVIDSTCLVWGKTCTSKGNCWLYDAQKMRFFINANAGGFLAVGLIFALMAWYYVKDVQIFDPEEEKKKVKFEIIEMEKEKEPKKI